MFNYNTINMYLYFNIVNKKIKNALGAAILILATDEHGETRIKKEEFNKLTIRQKKSICENT